MIEHITLNEYSKVPKYKQIINSIFAAIEKGEIKYGDKLPSVNTLLIEFDISRDTVVRAYEYLKKKGTIESVPGKGYYIKNDDLVLKAKVCLIFNKLSAHKKIIYDSFSHALGDNATIDFFVYNNNYRHFKELVLTSKTREYSHFVIIAHFEEGGEDIAEFIKKHLPPDKLLILDKKIEGLEQSVSCVYQDFENDIYSALIELNPSIEKYHQIKIIFPTRSYQPVEIKKGFKRFCYEYAYEHEIINEIEQEEITKNTAYISLKEYDLVPLIKKVKFANYAIGEDVGIISYNNTALKEVLLDGITVISTDFEKLGEQAANYVLKNKYILHKNPFYVILRNSL